MPSPQSIKSPYTDSFEALYEEYSDMKDQPQMHQFYKEMAELHVGFQIVHALEEKYIVKQANSELGAEAFNHERAELISALIEELHHIDQRILKSEELWDHVTQAKAEINYDLKDLLNT